jgi:hypothetical protein
MSTFYVLPPRPLLAARFAHALKGLLPGLDWCKLSWTELADVLGAAASCHPEVYVVHQEDLPDGEEQGQALADGFGAEPGDEVVEVCSGPTGTVARRRYLP